MYDAETQARFAKSCTGAMLGYMTATSAASTAAMGQVFDFWASAARGWAGEHPAVRTPPMMPMLPWGSPSFASGGMWPWPHMAGSDPAQAFMQPWDLWLSMTPFGRSPIVLQMAFAMMAFGVPRSVAMPAAEANAAAFEAAETAAAPFQDAFASYRSDGGHASAQIIHMRRVMTAALVSPLGAAAGWPWLTGTRAAGF